MFGFGKKSRIQHPSKFEHYFYFPGVRFDPGAAAEGFEPATTNPIQNVRAKTHTAIPGQWRTFSHPQKWFAQQVGMNGIGGLQAGTLRQQPLLDVVNE